MDTQTGQTQGAASNPREAVTRQTLTTEAALNILPTVSPPADSAGYRFVKRLMDILGALLLLMFGFPVVLAVALLIRVTGPGPVLFRQTRLGLNGTEFSLFKFRTMVVSAERQLADYADMRQRFEESFKIANDPRITPVGAFLRKTSLDELPQVVNVLQGSMSLIGPRPIVPIEMGKYGPCGEKLLTVKPGLGGMWQTHGRSDTTYAERIALDMYYIEHRSVWLDLYLLVKTAACVLTRRGSC